MEIKGSPFPQLPVHDRVCDFAFCIDITQHKNELNIHLQGANNLTVFTSRPTSLLAFNRAFLLFFFFVAFTFPLSMLISSAETGFWCAFSSSPSSYSWTFLMAYSKAKLKSNCDKASPCLRPF
jgi:hypothetical protein